MYQAKAWHGPLSAVSGFFPPDFLHSSGFYFPHSASRLIFPVVTQTADQCYFFNAKKTHLNFDPTPSLVRHSEQIARLFVQIFFSFENFSAKIQTKNVSICCFLTELAFTHKALDITFTLFNSPDCLYQQTKTKQSFRV